MFRLLSAMIFLFIFGLFVSCSDDQEVQTDFAVQAASELKNRQSFIDFDPSRLFEHYCGVCHGSTGEADGFNTFNLDPKPKSFLDSLFIKNNDSISILSVISNGGDGDNISKLMPPYKRTLSKKEREKLTSYILSLAQSEN